MKYRELIETDMLEIEGGYSDPNPVERKNEKGILPIIKQGTIWY